jgi:hypothetical protein
VTNALPVVKYETTQQWKGVYAVVIVTVQQLQFNILTLGFSFITFEITVVEVKPFSVHRYCVDCVF